jgi:hypothetical protein
MRGGGRLRVDALMDGWVLACACVGAQAACDTPQDRAAANRSQIHSLGWFADPLYFGQSVNQYADTYTRTHTHRAGLIAGHELRMVGSCGWYVCVVR